MSTPLVQWAERDGQYEAALSSELTAIVQHDLAAGHWRAEVRYCVAQRGVEVVGRALLGARPSRSEAEALALEHAASVAGLVQERR